MARQYIDPPGLGPLPSGFNHVVRAGNLVFVSGQISHDSRGCTLYPGDARAQYSQAWSNLERALESAGASLQDVAKTTTYVVRAEDLAKVREARLALLPQGLLPASSTVVVSALAEPELLVEVEAIVWVSPVTADRDQSHQFREDGIMERTYINPPDLAPPPRNLYSHVVKVENTVYISGQVSRGLDGSTMHPGDVEGQVRRAWTNLERAVQAAGGSIQDLVKTTTYVVGAENLGKVREARLALLPQGRRPTSTTVVVSALADPDLLVEIEAIAVIEGNSGSSK